MAKKQTCICPNCGEVAIYENNEIACHHCDAVFEVKRKEPKLKKMGAFEELEKRVSALEKTNEPESEPTPDDNKNNDNDDEPIIPR